MVAAGLPAAGVAVAVATVDPNDWKPRIEAAAQRATGRALSLRGPLRISRSLWPTIEASDVQLANLPGGSRPDMARIEKITARLDLLALLHRQLDITQLTLVGPNILFEEANHVPNWLFDTHPPDAQALGAPAPPPDSGSQGPGSQGSGSQGSGFTLAIRHVHIQNGMVTFRLPARTNVIGIRTLDFLHPTDGGPIDITSILVYSDFAPFTLDAHATPTGTTPDTAATAPWTTRIDFAAFDSTAHAEGSMDIAATYDLSVQAHSGALEKLNALLPAMQLPPLHGLWFSTHLRNGPVRGDLPVIGQTRLHFDSADLHDRIPGLTLATVDLSLPAEGGTADLQGQGAYAGQPFTLAGGIGWPVHPDGPNKVPLDLRATATTTASMALKGTLAMDSTDFAGLDAAITLRTPDLARLRPLVSPALPALTQVALNGQLTLPANLATLTLRRAKLTAKEGELNGDASFGLGGKVDVTAKLQSPRLDLDATLLALGLGSDDTPAPATGPVFSATPLPWAQLRGPRLDVTADIANLTFQQQPWRDVGLNVRLADGKLSLDRAQFALPGGPVEAAFTADASQAQPAVRLVVHAPTIPLAAIIHRLGLPGAATGTLKLDADLRAAGASPRALAASLDGSLSATAGAGSLSNAALVAMASAALTALNITVPAQGETKLRCLGLVGTVTKGLAKLRTIALDTTYLQLIGAGEIDLGQETVALKLHPQAGLAGSSVTVPVVVEGPFRNIQGRLDATGLDKLGLFIDALFGGDSPQTCSDAGLLPIHPG